jgi:hypothetical protein
VLDGVTADHATGLPEVRSCEDGCGRVEFHSNHAKAGSSEGEGVSADPATEVDDLRRTRVTETFGAPQRHVCAGGLLEGVPCEEQSGGSLPELGDGPAAQFRLGEDR